MAGTTQGGQAAAETNKRLYGSNWYAKIGAVGGRNGHTGGFAAGKEGRRRARIAGGLGGTVSRRGRKLSAKEHQEARERYITARPYTTGLWRREPTEEELQSRQSIISKHGHKRPW